MESNREAMEGRGERAPRRATARWLVLAMATLVSGPPLTQAGIELYRSRWVQALEVVTTPPTREALRRFEEQLEERSWLVGWARRSYARWVDELFERGNAKVVYGLELEEETWLFYRQAVRWVAAPPFEGERARRVLELPEDGARDPLAAIVDFDRQLRARGISLLVVPVPVKATLYPEHLWAGADPAGLPTNPGLPGFLRRLEAAGVVVVDPTTELLRAKLAGERVFLPRDTHWTPEGMQRVARQVAGRVEELGLLEAVPRPPATFERRWVRFRGPGDLAEMLTTAERASAFPPMTVELEQVIAAGDGGAGDDPIRRSSSPVLLLGDSLTNVFSSAELRLGRQAGFGEHLAAELGLGLDVIAMPGAGASRARETLALRPRGLEGKRLVIWELSQRDLLFPSPGWRKVELPAATGEAPEVAEDGGARSVTARVAAVSEPPELQDYADCLMIVRYRLLEGRLPETPQGGYFFVAYWGWKGFAPTEAAAYRQGDLHDLRLSPLGEHADLESTCWVDTTGLDRRPWWALGVEVR